MYSIIQLISITKMSETKLFDICEDTYKKIIINGIVIDVCDVINECGKNNWEYAFRIIDKINNGEIANFDRQFKHIIESMINNVNSYYDLHWFTFGKRFKLAAIYSIYEAYVIMKMKESVKESKQILNELEEKLKQAELQKKENELQKK